MKTIENSNILIVGLGLIGGSYARALNKHHMIPMGEDIDEETMKYALEHHMIDSNFLSLEEKIQRADFIILGLYPSQVVPWIEHYQPYMKEGTLITDVTGVKRRITYQVEQILRKDVEFIASHPMAGKETSGILHASADLFQKANFIITPTLHSSKDSIEWMKQFALLLGCKYIEILTPEQHDEIIGFLSQLPHAIAVALMNSHEAENYIKYTGDSFRDLTRIAKVNEALWSELFISNQDYLISEIDQFIIELEKLKQDIKENRITDLKEKFQTSKAKRKLFDKI